MTHRIILDLETQKDFNEVGGRNKHHLLRISVAGIYSYLDDRYSIFGEKDIHKLGEILVSADQIIGYNIRQFDYAVLKPYLNFSIEQIPTLDILEEIEKTLGHRIGLDSVASATLGIGKTGTGLQAISLWRAGQLEELQKYCLNDVKITKEVYEYGRANGKLNFKDFFEIRSIPVNFPEAAPRENVAKQVSLF